MQLVSLVLLAGCCWVLSACAALGPDSALGRISSIALESIGLKKIDTPELPTAQTAASLPAAPALPTMPSMPSMPAVQAMPTAPAIPEIPESLKPARNVELKLHAGTNLNAGNTNQALSLLTRVYKLKQTGAFYAAPYDAFLSPEKEKAALGADLIEVREFNMIPGQLYQATEKVSRESSYVGIVTLFRTPATQRWRAAFAAKDAESLGIVIGLHACSITVGSGAKIDQDAISAAAILPSGCQ